MMKVHGIVLSVMQYQFNHGFFFTGAVAFDLAEYAENNNLPLAGVIVENSKYPGSSIQMI